jgi:hypothetical protein
VGLATALTADAAAMLAVPHKPFNRGNRAVDADVPDPEVSALVEVAVAEDAVGVARAEALSTSFCKRGNREAVFAFAIVVAVEELVPVTAEVSVAIIDEEEDDNDPNVVAIALCVVLATAVATVVATVVASSTNVLMSLVKSVVLLSVLLLAWSRTSYMASSGRYPTTVPAPYEV